YHLELRAASRAPQNRRLGVRFGVLCRLKKWTMSIVDFVFHPRGHEARDPEQLRDLLFEAARKNRQQFERLCRANRPFILKHFPEWRKLPAALPLDQASVQRYGDGLMAIACF